MAATRDAIGSITSLNRVSRPRGSELKRHQSGEQRDSGEQHDEGKQVRKHVIILQSGEPCDIRI